jgi:hypothetical protein
MRLSRILASKRNQNPTTVPLNVRLHLCFPLLFSNLPTFGCSDTPTPILDKGKGKESEDPEIIENNDNHGIFSLPSHLEPN